MTASLQDLLQRLGEAGADGGQAVVEVSRASDATPLLEHDHFSSNRHPARSCWDRALSRARLGRLLGLAGLAGRIGLEEHAAFRRELLPVSGHAGRDAIDVGDLGPAKPHRIGAARLLLLVRIGLTSGRQHRQ